MKKVNNNRLKLTTKLFILGQLADFITTYMFTRLGMREANIFYVNYGWTFFILTKILMTMVVVFCMNYILPNKLYFKIWEWIFCIVSWFGAVWNIYWMIVKIAINEM